MSGETSEGTNDCRAGGNSETNDSGVETNFETLNDCEVIYALPPPPPEPNFCQKILFKVAEFLSSYYLFFFQG